jgi:hypothetical protein
MSLKAVHLLFIVLSTLLSAGMGWWAWGRYPLMAYACAVVAVALAVYGVWFVKKLKDVSYL